jgi:thiamine-monophosphate kinase
VPLPEKRLIEQIARQALQVQASRSKGVLARKGGCTFRVAALLAGIGDDCTVLRLPSARDILITTDFSLEGVHFRREWHPPESVGHRCLARGLSDIAAMGGEPVAAFLSLALPASSSQRWVGRFVRGLLALSKRFSVPLAGGDIAESNSGVLADIVVLGLVPPGRAVLRSGARPGDRIYVTGKLGASALAFSGLLNGAKLLPRDYLSHFYPTPRITVGRVLREKGIPSAMIDISDGLSTDLHHICEQSGVGARIYADRIPVTGGAKNLKFALHGGEDYELIFTAPARKHVPRTITGAPVTQLGEITGTRRVSLVKDGHESVLKSAGWEHFRKP